MAKPFEKGFDSRRHTGGKQRVIIAHGMTMTELAQQWTNDSINLLGQIVTNTNEDGTARAKPYSSQSRIKAAIALLDRGHGKPESILKLSEAYTDVKALETMPTSKLLQLINNKTLNSE